jgi:hypothetical protein
MLQGRSAYGMSRGKKPFPALTSRSDLWKFGFYFAVRPLPRLQRTKIISDFVNTEKIGKCLWKWNYLFRRVCSGRIVLNTSVHDSNMALGTVHCLLYIWCVRRFGSRLYSHLQIIVVILTELDCCVWFSGLNTSLMFNVLQVQSEWSPH